MAFRPPPTDLSPEQLFLAHLRRIERVIDHACRRYHFPPEEAQDFASTVKVKLVEDDYGVIRKFQGKSSLATYLTVVIQRLMLDYLNHLWGKWRPSAEAERLGPVAILLERLMVRDRFTFDEACEILRTNHHVEMSWRDLARLAARLPRRETRRQEDEQEIQHMAAPGAGTEERVLEEEKASLRRKVEEALGRAVAALPEEDRVIVRMSMWDNFTVAQIARILGLDQKPLYRRLHKTFDTLRESLEREGIRREDIDDVLGS